jgi:carbon storage regulator
MTMLVLTRRVMQSIMIGDDVEVVVTEVKGEKVRLGIVAPPHVAVHRREVYERIQSQKAAVAYGNGSLQLVTTDLLPDL